jgi:hypothetical protein
MSDLLQYPVQVGHFHAVRGMPGREQLKKLLSVLTQEDTLRYPFKTIPLSVQMWGRDAPEAFKDCSSDIGRLSVVRRESILAAEPVSSMKIVHLSFLT